MIRLGVLLLAFLTLAIAPTVLSAKPVPAPGSAFSALDHDDGWYRDRDDYYRHHHHRYDRYWR